MVSILFKVINTLLETVINFLYYHLIWVQPFLFTDMDVAV